LIRAVVFSAAFVNFIVFYLQDSRQWQHCNNIIMMTEDVPDNNTNVMANDAKRLMTILVDYRNQKLSHLNLFEGLRICVFLWNCFCSTA
jgi:hypothetical protein